MEFHITPTNIEITCTRTSINPKCFLKQINIYRQRSGAILSQYVGVSVFKIHLEV